MKQRLKRILPIIGVCLALGQEFCVKNSYLHPQANHAYYKGLLFVLLAVFTISAIVSIFSRKAAKFIEYKGAFFFGVLILIVIINFVTAKRALLPVIFFPSYDNIIAVFFEQTDLLVKCVLYSFRLLLTGVFWGITVGFVTGVVLGFSAKAYYWINPLIKLIGPIPATAWIPLVLTTFPTTFGASVFIIALAVWFPVTLMTSSGIQNITQNYFEVAKTLGASSFFQITRICIPAAMPNIFQGIFTGICSAFVALMTAEMFGAKYGIGWYISYQKAMMAYAGVYAGLVMIALFCTLILTALFKIRAKVLAWQKGLIKW